MFRVLASLASMMLVLLFIAPTDTRAAPPDMQKLANGIWIDRQRLGALPTAGVAWDALKAAADQPMAVPNLSNQEDPTNVLVLARALVYARTGESRYRDAVVDACMAAIGTEDGGSSLALGRELMAYVLAADLVGLPLEQDAVFRTWLGSVVNKPMSEGRTLRQTHAIRPNGWGTFAGASRFAVAAYLGNQEELAEIARIFRGWLGDRTAYADFSYGELDWQADPANPVGINPFGSARDGNNIDGVIPEGMRRCCVFTWPPPHENYVYSTLQGALAQAVMLERAGYDVFGWQDKALLRAFEWLHTQANYPAEGDDTWQPHLVNYYYGRAFPAPLPSRPGKNVGYTDWTHGRLPRPRNLRILP
jgi:hypothetical protein